MTPTRATRSSYDALRIEHDQGDVEIVVYNRTILLFRTESKAVRRIREVCCRLDDLAVSTPPVVAFRPSNSPGPLSAAGACGVFREPA
jgi:hypothetical protein